MIVAAAGNEAHDLGHPDTDDISPDWPPDTAIVREVRNNCRVAPAELPGVVTVSATGSTRSPATRTSARRSTSPRPVATLRRRRATTFGRGRILAGWSSTDATGTWEALRRQPSGRERRRPVCLDQRNVDGVAARGRCRRAHPPASTRACRRARWRRCSLLGDAMACPADWPADDPRQCSGGRGQHVVLRSRDGQRRGR